MKMGNLVIIVLMGLCLAAPGFGAQRNGPVKKRIMVVSSYHREYIWTQETNRGLCDAMLKTGYFDSNDQAVEYTKNDYVETSKMILKKLWMDAKRKKSKEEKAEATATITKISKSFKPDLIMLGDDDAAEYIGGQFLDTKIPVVFWGVNNTPVKYGLVESVEKPGHNVTGVYQAGYYAESLEFLKVIVPRVKTFAVLVDDTSTGRSHLKAIEYLVRKGDITLKLVETVSTGEFEVWKRKALELQNSIDAFFVAHYAALKDEKGNYVPPEEVARWYLANIKIPEAVEQRQFIEHGMLGGADDSAYNQGYEAVVVAHDILAKRANPATYPPRAPKRGPLIVNRQRAEMLGIKLTPEMGIEEYIEKASALSGTEK